MLANQLPSEYNIQELNAIIELDQLLMNFPPLLALSISELRKKLRELDISVLSGKTEADWETLIKKITGGIQFPKQYNTSSTPIQDYARDIVRRLANKYPASALITRIGKTEIPTRNEIQKILINNTAFDVANQAAHTWFTVTEKPRLPNEITQQDLVKIQELQRCIKLTEGVHKMNQIEALMLSGITSARKIYTMGIYDFSVVMQIYSLTVMEINFIACRAKSINDTVNYLSVQYIRYDVASALVPQAIMFGTQTDNTPLQIPDMQAIFGSLNTCSCSDCQSVYSAAAYFADLLHWVKSDVVCKNSGVSAYNVLTGATRRPDLPYILLNCKNTNTLMPYIDLVNEILSINLLNIPIDYTVLQTTKNTPELLQQPEHRFYTAEAKLQSAYFPLNLPYDANLDESVSYLDEIGTSYHELVNTFSKPVEKYNTEFWAKAFLNLNDNEYTFITNSTSVTPTYWNDFWGITSNAAPATIGSVLKNAELEFDELKELLQSIYITKSTQDVNNSISIVPSATDDCDIDKYTFSTPFGNVIADRFLKFLRLKRKCGLSVWELDLAIVNFCGFGGAIDTRFIIHLCSCIALSKKYNISFSDVMLLTGDKVYQDLHTNITVQFKPTPYFTNRFQNNLSPETNRLFFTPGATGNCFLKLISTLDDTDKQKLGAVLSLSIPEIDILTTYFLATYPSSFTSGLLSSSNISYYDRYSKLSRIMGIEISEMIVVFDFITDPILSGPLTPERMWSFTNQWNDFRSLNVKPSVLKDITLGEGYYAIDGVGKATSTDFALSIKTIWEKTRDAVLDTRSAFLNAYNSNNLPDLVLHPDAPLLQSIVYKKLADSFSLETTAAQSIVEGYSATWIQSFIGESSSWDWTALEVSFTTVYRLLNRVSILSELCGLDTGGIESGILIGIDGTLQFTVTNAFYWLKNNYGSFNVVSLLSIKKVIQQAAQLGVSQKEYFKQIELLKIDIPFVTIADSTPTAVRIYGLLGVDNVLKKTSLFEFVNIYHRAQSVAGNNHDLISVVDALIPIVAVINKVGGDIGEIWSCIWSNYPPDGNKQKVNIGNCKTELRRILHTKYGTEEAWSKCIIPIQNGLRRRLRDALVAYYIGKLGFKNTNELYSHFLLDTEMEACMKTSRIVLAISAVQLLIHRGLLGLEPTICIDQDDKNEWEWRKNYQVWVANRKIFLYPENWIEPSLRLDKSSFFKDAEDLLLQDEINDQNCEKAFSNYLTNLNEVARLDIRGTYVDEKIDPDTLHVFGRTWNAPYTYFYRRRVKNIWTPWEKLELDIDGDHIIPIMFNRRMYLLWPLFVDKEHRTIKQTINGVEQNAPYTEVKMCYSKLEFGKWSGKKILNGTMYAGKYAGIGVSNDLDKKLGKGIPPPIPFIAANPLWWPWGWKNLPNEMPDNFSHYGEYRVQYIYSETYRGTPVLDNPNFQDYSYVSPEKKSFFFWAEVLDVSGDLIIHCRRELHSDWETWHDGYSELAYEDSFRISACDEKLEIIPPMNVEPGTNKRYLARPYLTQIDGMLLKQGLNKVGQPTPKVGLFVKKIRTPDPNSIRLFQKTDTQYTLTYPHQYKDAMWSSPFFFSDKKHTFFFERAKNKSCVCTIVYDGVNFSNDCHYEYPLTNKFIVKAHEHPYSCTMLAEFNRFGIKGLLNSENPNIKRQQKVESYFGTDYVPELLYIKPAFPTNNYDFDRDGAYSSYNWEVFFHLVSVVVRQLRQNNKFAEALRWIQFVFDPTNRDSGLGLQRVWKIKPFMIDVTNGSIQSQMKLLSGGNLTTQQLAKKDELIAQIEDWRDNPFEPHRIASMRNRAYMLWTVMEFIDILTDWGDWLFRQDTMESINEAANLYILASTLLGERPKKASKSSSAEVSFHQIANGIDPFSNAAVNIENQMTGITFSSNCTCDSNAYSNNSGVSLPNLIFCIPDNPKLLEYWNKVEDRLFKIRHCMNVDGKVRELALFQPPIDPALLVRAKALGLDISEVLSDLASPSPHYRFSYLLQKATDFCNEVKSLGGQLLSAFEKRDAEELTLIRQLHEQNILKASRNLKKLQIDEAKQSLKSLEHSKKLIEIRLSDYENREFISGREQNTISKTKAAEGLMYVEQAANLVSSVLTIVPDPFVGFPSNFVGLPGGKKLGLSAIIVGGAAGIISAVYRNQASMSGTYAGYARRQEDWDLSIKTAKEELEQIEVQLLGAEIRVAVTEKELENHDLQMEQSSEIYDWVKSKFTNQKLYSWMSGELMKLHRRAYELAYDMAKMAQQAFKKELNGSEFPVKFGNWDSSKKGLLAGDNLSVQLKELESNYMKLNTREFELTKSISLKLLSPDELFKLIMDGKCTVSLPDWLFNLEFDDENLYAMRIKSIGVSLPCITGPQTSTNIKLKLMRSWIGWKENDPFHNFANSPSINEEIITSSAQNDSAVFEMNLRDERYMPFENQGVVSEWEISLPNQHEFDYSTISDLVFHVRYVAKGKNVIPQLLPTNIHNNAELKYTQHAMSLKHDFPQEWGMITSTSTTAQVTLISLMPSLTRQYIPYRMRLANKTGGTISELYYLYKDTNDEIIIKQVPLPNPTADVTIQNTKITKGTQILEDIWIVYNLT